MHRGGCGKGGSPRTSNVMQTGSVRKDHKGESGGHGPTTEAPKYIVQEAPLHQLHVHFITGVRAGVRLVSEQDQEARLCSCRGCNAPGPAWPARRQHCTQQPARLCRGTSRGQAMLHPSPWQGLAVHPRSVTGRGPSQSTQPHPSVSQTEKPRPATWQGLAQGRPARERFQILRPAVSLHLSSPL